MVNLNAAANWAQWCVPGNMTQYPDHPVRGYSTSVRTGVQALGEVPCLCFKPIGRLHSESGCAGNTAPRKYGTFFGRRCWHDGYFHVHGAGLHVANTAGT
jgi:hypothetical protein